MACSVVRVIKINIDLADADQGNCSFELADDISIGIGEPMSDISIHSVSDSDPGR